MCHVHQNEQTPYFMSLICKTKIGSSFYSLKACVAAKYMLHHSKLYCSLETKPVLPLQNTITANLVQIICYAIIGGFTEHNVANIATYL